jgi:hypothetical protein
MKYFDVTIGKKMLFGMKIEVLKIKVFKIKVFKIEVFNFKISGL